MDSFPPPPDTAFEKKPDHDDVKRNRGHRPWPFVLLVTFTALVSTLGMYRYVIMPWYEKRSANAASVVTENKPVDVAAIEEAARVKAERAVVEQIAAFDAAIANHKKRAEALELRIKEIETAKASASVSQKPVEPPKVAPVAVVPSVPDAAVEDAKITETAVAAAAKLTAKSAELKAKEIKLKKDLAELDPTNHSVTQTGSSSVQYGSTKVTVTMSAKVEPTEGLVTEIPGKQVVNPLELTSGHSPMLPPGVDVVETLAQNQRSAKYKVADVNKSKIFPSNTVGVVARCFQSWGQAIEVVVPTEGNYSIPSRTREIQFYCPSGPMTVYTQR